MQAAGGNEGQKVILNKLAGWQAGAGHDAGARVMGERHTTIVVTVVRVIADAHRSDRSDNGTHSFEMFCKLPPHEPDHQVLHVTNSSLMEAHIELL